MQKRERGCAELTNGNAQLHTLVSDQRDGVVHYEYMALAKNNSGVREAILLFVGPA